MQTWRGSLRPPGGYDQDDPGDPLWALNCKTVAVKSVPHMNAASRAEIEWQPIATLPEPDPYAKVWIEAYWPTGAISNPDLPAIRQCYRWWGSEMEDIWVDIDGEAHDMPPTHFRKLSEPPDTD